MAIGDGVITIASLGVTFGGFSPTAMSDVVATKEQVERMEAARALKREADERRRKIELARASAPKRYTDAEGAIWTYVVMDNAFARIDNCKREIENVTIPSEIDGLPVKALGSDIFNESEKVVEIICPDSIESIGSCAFRLLPNLKRVVFPANVATFSASWLQHCESIEEIVLPGMLDEISSAVFDNPSLKSLHVGRAVYGVKLGACEKTRLETLVVNPANPFLFCDGDALYSFDKSILIALARPVSEYRIIPGCISIAKKACMGIKALEQVELPDSVQVIGEFAFAHTSLREVDVPAAVTEISAKAFFHCSQLETVRLHDGLCTIGDSAFAESGLKGLFIPSSIQHIGASITANTNIVHSGDNVTFEISPDSPLLFFDGQGGLYRREDDGIHFIQLIDRQMRSYRVFEGTRFIDEYAFAFHDRIEDVVLPEGVEEIRKNAFRVCGKLNRVKIPDSLVSIGKEAFIDTTLAEIYLPAGFMELADDALVTAGAHRLGEPPSLRAIVVNEGNERFYVESGLLCRHGDKGDRGIVFNDDVPDVRIPDNVTTIADFAFSNARNIRTFSIGPNLKTIGTSGFATWSSIENIHIELAQPIEGRSVFDIAFPRISRSIHEISISLGGSSWVNVPELFRHYDNCLTNAHSYYVPSDDDISAYEQVRLILRRLKDPIMLVQVNKAMFERLIREHLVEMCVDIARHDDRASVNDLCDFGFLNRDNLEDVIVAVGRLQDAAMTGYLLELKRRRFGQAAFDFDL